MVASAQDILAGVRQSGRAKPMPQEQIADIYIRLSKDHELNNLPMQRSQALAYAKKLNVPVRGVIEDIKSGLLTRSGYEEMIERARNGHTSHIILYNFDRFGRDDIKMLSDFDDLAKRGVEVHDVAGGKIDRATAGRKAMQANEEVRATSRRVYDTLIYKFTDEEYAGMPRNFPAGYRRTINPGYPEIDATIGPIVTEVFKRYAAGATLGAVTAYWNEQTGEQRRTTSVAKMLRNPYYMGNATYNVVCRSKLAIHHVRPADEWLTKKHDLPLIDEATFMLCRARLDKNLNVGQQRTTAPRYPLTGITFCATCKNIKDRTKKEENKHTRGMTDPKTGYVALACPHCYESKSYVKVEEALRELLTRVPLGDSAIAAAAALDAPIDVVASQQAIQAQINKLRKRRATLIMQNADGDIDPTDYRTVMTETDSDLKRLQNELEATAKEQTTSVSTEAAITWLKTLPDLSTLLDDASVEYRNGIYKELFSRVTIDYKSSEMIVSWSPALALLMHESDATILLPTHNRYGKATL